MQRPRRAAWPCPPKAQRHALISPLCLRPCHRAPIDGCTRTVLICTSNVSANGTAAAMGEVIKGRNSLKVRRRARSAGRVSHSGHCS